MKSRAEAPAAASAFRSTNEKARRTEPAGFFYNNRFYQIRQISDQSGSGVLTGGEPTRATTADSRSLLTSAGFS